MVQFTQRLLRFLPAGAALLLLAAFPSFAVTAATSHHPGAAVAMASHHHGPLFHTKVYHVHFSTTGTHFVYADDGLCPNSIDAYQITTNGLVPVSGEPYPTTGCQNIAAFGVNQIAISKANTLNSTPCLFHTDESSGQVESFMVNATTGQLTGPISVLTIGDGYDNYAGDIHVSNNGRFVYVAVWSFSSTGNLSALAVGSGCTLSLVQQLATPNNIYFSIAIVNKKQLIAVDFGSGNIDTYKISPTTGTITFLTSAAGQIPGYYSTGCCGPDGAAVQRLSGTPPPHNIYTGIATFNGGEVQGALDNNGTLTFLPGSPAFDPNYSENGAYVLFSRKHQFIIESETFSNSLGVYSIASGTLTFVNQTYPPGVSDVSALARLGTTLFVNSVFNGVLDTCSITASGVGNCMTAATLTGAGSGVAEGVATF
jgi:6-phosphogluconolactonase (cycloisomerase 2 family)